METIKKEKVVGRIIFDKGVEEEYRSKNELFKYLSCWEETALNKIHILLDAKIIDQNKAIRLKELLYIEVTLGDCYKDKAILKMLKEVMKELGEYHLFDDGFGTTINNGVFKNNWKVYNKQDEGKIGRVAIDSYHYGWPLDEDKEDYYTKHTNTEEETAKTDSINRRVVDYIRTTEGEEKAIHYQIIREDSIHYREGLGYISIMNPDRDDEMISGWGLTEDEAFITAITEYAFRSGDYYEYNNRDELKVDFQNRFPDKPYQGGFYFAEYAFQQLKRYYGENIPEVIVDYLEKYLNNEYRFDYNEGKLVTKVKNLEPTLKPQE